jgi:hypothetical protein
MKGDRRRTPSPLRELILRPDEPLRVFVMRFNKTQTYKALVVAVRNLSWLC